MRRRIAIVASHPIQYHAHWYRELARAEDLDLEVLYCHEATQRDQAESGFGVDFAWDIPLLEGYRYRFLKNAARRPGVSKFGGMDSPELRGIIIHERYDAVVVSGWHTKSYWQAILACRECGTPVMVRSDSHLHDDRSTLMRLAKWTPYHYFISRFDACLAAGTWSREYFLHYGAKPERVFIVPHCVPKQPAGAPDAQQLQTAREAARRQWDIPRGATVFLFAGKFIARKRPLDFIRAVATAATGNPAVYGLMAGDGPMRAEAEALTAGLRAPITFAGFLNQRAIQPAYAASDILVLPSDQDTWGLVVNEAMIHGRACIVSDRAGCGPDLIVGCEPDPINAGCETDLINEDARTGFIFPTGDVDALAGYMVRIADTPGMAERMGAEAARLIGGHSAAAAVSGLREAVAAIMENG